MLKLTTDLLIQSSYAKVYWTTIYPAGNSRKWDHPGVDEDTAKPIWEKFDRLVAVINRFEREVWYQGLQALVMKSKRRGLSGERNDLKVLFYSMCGRTMITIADTQDRYQITLLTATDEEPFQRRRLPESDNWGPMGLHGIEATESDAAYMLDCLISYWKEFNISEDQEIEVGYTVPNE